MNVRVQYIEYPKAAARYSREKVDLGKNRVGNVSIRGEESSLVTRVANVYLHHRLIDCRCIPCRIGPHESYASWNGWFLVLSSQPVRNGLSRQRLVSIPNDDPDPATPLVFFFRLANPPALPFAR